MDSEATEYFKVTVLVTDDDDQSPGELEVTHSPDEEENGPENGIGLALTLTARKRFESVSLTPQAAERLRDALDAALAYRSSLK
ncbi:hypothetical protein ACFWNN_45310 [Lentzea sp. NPDC058450]|uniref:hypothetical protein n=1 Tax=Lentzea sp. NPDC058450 TaxID=3346505 RepID=UPI00365DDE02